MLRLVQLESCGSTNDEAWSYLPDTTLVVTRHQARGRGRQGRRWEDDAGNIMASLALVPPESLTSNMFWVPLAAGVACIEAIELATGQSDLAGLRLKWPNDIMWADEKMGGILCESRLKGESVSGLVVGLGLNLARAPEVTEMKTTCLARHVRELEDDSSRLELVRGQLLGHWAERVQFWIEELAQGRTLRLREAWRAAAKLEIFSDFSMHGEDGRIVKLKALDLDETGRLKAQSGSGEIVYLDQPD